MITDPDGIYAQVYMESRVSCRRRCLASDLACCVAAGQYGGCAGVGRVLRSDGCVSVVAGEHDGELDLDVSSLAC